MAAAASADASASASAPASSPALLRVLGVAQSYEWGKLGASSAVGQLMAAAAAPNTRDAAAAAVPAFTLTADKPYAELWMGTHASGPSRVLLASGESALLRDHLGGELPFLFKILSVHKALSIQAHPDESLARRLHAERPTIYKDPHHKPELACAVTPFEALCAFRPLGEVAQHARQHPELRALLGAQLAERLQTVAGALAADDTGADASAAAAAERKALLRDVFAALMTPSPQLLAEQIAALQKRLEAEGVKASVPAGEAGATADASSSSASSSSSSSCQPLAVAPLMLRLLAQYPGDVGVFAPLVLNAFSLPVGGAMFLGPCEPHAYLSGDCVECMACSDNVVRAGLTPKLRDTDVLVSMLTYAERTAAAAVMTPTQVAVGVTEFAPPRQFGEFRLRRAEAAAAASTAATVTLPALAGASIALVWSGVGSAAVSSDSSAPAQPLRRGDVFLVPAGAAVVLQQDAQDAKESLLVYQCAANDAQ